MRCDIQNCLCYLFFSVLQSFSLPIDEYSILSIPAQSDSSLAKVVLPDAISTAKSDSKEILVDCSSQRLKSLKKKSSGDSLVYVPICARKNSSLYESVQCHESTQYCWCVHEQTGEPIPGSTSLIDKPRCVQEKVGGRKKKKKSKKNRCKAKRRSRFLRRLVSSIKTEYIMAGNNTSVKVGRDAALSWKFKQLDKNNNKIMERSEWRPYKTVLLRWKRVRHCSRSLFKSCDLDRNRKLSMDEWKKCLFREVNRVPAKRPEQLNPFLYILKPE